MSEQNLIPREQAEYLQVLKDLRVVLGSPEGRSVMRYLIKAYGVAEKPQIFPDDKQTYKYMGVQEAGVGIFELITAADPTISADLLARVFKEKLDAQ